MEWLNLHISTIDSPEATLCDPVRRATWIWLLRFCIGQENGGRIVGCGAWGDTTWQQMAKVRLREVKSVSSLWHWDCGDLVVHFYPADKEAEVQANRENGRKGGRPPGKKDNHKDNHPDNHPVISGSEKDETTRFEIAKTERKGREGKGMEVEVEGNCARERAGQEPPRTPAEVVDEQLASMPPGPPARWVRRLTVGDLAACHPTLLCHRPDDRDRAGTLLALYGWEAMTSSIRELEPIAKARPEGKRRVMLSELGDHLAANWQLTPEDYRRAGLPVPQEAASCP